MKKQCFGLMVLMCAAAFAADVAPLDVKAGEWETTVNTQGAGAIAAAAIPPDVLSKMSPDQRAKVEAALKQANQPKTTVSRKCVKKEDLSKPLTLGNNRTCKETLVDSSRTKQEVHVDCDDKGGKVSGTVRVEALSSENIKVDMQFTVAMNGQTMSMNNTATAKWLGAACTEK
jgi:hypothetical protein